MARRAKRQQEQAAAADPSSDNSSESEVTPEVAAPVAPLSTPHPALQPASKQPAISSTQQINAKASTETVATMNGTIHVKVLKANNLPTMDFGKRQDPFGTSLYLLATFSPWLINIVICITMAVLVQLNKSNPKSWATTDPAFNGNTTPEWGEGSNNELELFYDASVHGKEAILSVEVYSNETGDELIGSGQLNVSAIVQKQSTKPNQESVRLDDNRGEVLVEVWFGPPVRKAFRAAGRATKLLDARDAFVATCCSVVATMSRYVQMPTDFAKKHRKVSVAVAAVVGIMAAGAITMFLAIAVPTILVAFFTFPFWILPFLATSFFTAPLWVPVLLLVGLFLLFIATFVFGLGATSRPVRRKGALISNKIKHSDVGKRVVYEKTV